MFGLIIASSLMKMFGGFIQGEAAQTRANDAAAEQRRDAQFAEQAAGDAVEKGTLIETQEAMKGTAVTSRALVQQSGSGADVTTGGAQQVRASTDAVVEVDRAIVRRNAQLEAYGLRAKARSHQQQATNDIAEGKTAFWGSFLGGLVGGGGDVGKMLADKSGGSGEAGSSVYTFNGGDPN